MTISEAELSAHRITTKWFVKADSFECALVRNSQVPDGAGGYTMSSITLPLQTLRMVPLQDSTSNRISSDGRLLRPRYMLIGEWEVTIEKFDNFVKDDRRYEVVFVLDNDQYQVKAEVAYLGE